MLYKEWFSHRLLVIMLVVALLSGSATPVLCSEGPAEVAAAPKHITLTWTDDTRTTQTITWKTAVTSSNGQVQYVEATADGSFFGNVKTVAAKAELFSTDLGDMTIHSVTLTGLKPGIHYLYRVGYGAEWSEVRSFATAAINVPEFKFLVFGDSQSDNYDIWHSVLYQAYEANLDAVFLTNVGDLVEVGQQDCAQWDAWFDAAQQVIGTIPIMPLTGNHETYTPVWGERSMPTMFTAQFKLPNNGPEDLVGQVYSFDYGNVHFVMLDSQEREEGRFVPDMLERQQAWLEKDLAITDKPWKIVFFHRPPYHSKSASENESIRLTFVPVLDRYHVDIVFNGHEHVYARTYSLSNDAMVDRPDKGTIYITAGRSGTKANPNICSNDWHEAFYNPVDEPNYITVKIIGDLLTVKAFKQSGALIDSWSIDKTK
ncbi:MAG: metallophosphoesterase [Firmicutes bacterium]|nr:metallophosphoesterase [Bacillota bacterium]